MRKDIPIKTIERLALYRRLLRDLTAKGLDHLYSHQLAELANNTSAQVRRDLMITGYTGTPRKGYDVKELINRINSILDDISEQKIALIGIGNLGRAILSYFSYQQPTLSIVAAFDSDESKTNRVIGGCRCYHIREFDEKIKELKITLGIITVPAQHAQDVADMMTQAGIKGILNFAPVPLRVPEEVFTDRIDITTALEKIAYFASSD
jgi:redox-sensing transcriptional repressor